MTKISPLPSLFSIYTFILSAVCITSYIAIALLELQSFSTLKTSILLLPCLTLFWAKVKPLLQSDSNIQQDRLLLTSFTLLTLLVAASYFRFPTSNYLIGGQDQGVYVNTGNHIARTGTVLIQDTLPNLLAKKTEIHDTYVRQNYKWIKPDGNGIWKGAFIPGIYVLDFEKRLLHPQFYHLHSLWLAISAQILGTEHTTTIVGLFSLLSIVAAYLLTTELTKKRAAGLLVAALLTVNPVHSYFARFPVSETLSLFFFLSGLLFLVRGRSGDWINLSLSALAFGCLFFTRITGFICIPAIVCYLVFYWIREDNKLAIRNHLFYILSVLSLYAWSFTHGLLYSHGYAKHIYSANFGLGGDLIAQGHLVIPLSAIILVLLKFAIARYQITLRRLLAVATSHESITIFLVLLFLILYSAYQGYQIAFTDAFTNSPWHNEKWKLAGTGINSILRYNLVVLGRVLGFVPFIFSIAGLFLVLRRGLTLSSLLPLGLLSLCFFTVLTILKGTTPYFYYYARYLHSELLSLLLICSVIFLFNLLSKSRSKALSTTLVALFVLSGIYPGIRYSLAHAKNTEQAEVHSSLTKLNSLFSTKSIVFIDKRFFPVVELVTPLRMTFNRQTFAFHESKTDPQVLSEAWKLLSQDGYDIFLLSTQKSWRKNPHIKGITKVVIPTKTLRAKKRSDIPTRYRTNKFHIGVYKYQPETGSN